MLLPKKDERYRRRAIKVEPKWLGMGLGRNSSHLVEFSIFFFSGSMKKFNQLARKKKNFSL